MATRRLLYIGALIGCLIFFTAYQQWFGYLVLLIILGLPWFSLLISLPAMLRFRLELSGADAVNIGGKGEIKLQGGCDLPAPPFKGKLRLYRCTTGERWNHKAGQALPTAHCGALLVTMRRTWVYDHLGLIGIPIRRKAQKYVLVRPTAIPVETPPDLGRFFARAWKPKPGGGYAENHELRLYHPGDSLNQIHWKLTAKTGKLMLREPMQPDQRLMLLTMDIKGSAAELDDKFGKLLYLGGYLLENSIRFEIRAMTAEGLVCHPVETPADLTRAIDALLCCGPTGENTIRTQRFAASWQYHIGGGSDEA